MNLLITYSTPYIIPCSFTNEAEVTLCDHIIMYTRLEHLHLRVLNSRENLHVQYNYYPL